MPSTTINTTSDISVDDVEFARGAARYLRNAGLTDEAIASSLADELGLDLTDARHITLTI